MKAEFALVALPISALIAPSAFAVQYLTVDQAQRAIFPGKSFTTAPVKLTSLQRKAIEQASGVRVLHDEQQVWRVRVVAGSSSMKSSANTNSSLMRPDSMSMVRSSRLKSWT